jgi:V/A-type H+-transporting ATPase subunit K
MDTLIAQSEIQHYIVVTLGWIGVFCPMALGAVGSIIGCTRAGQAAVGALLELEGGYGKYIGISAMPASQTIYGIAVMWFLKAKLPVVSENAPGLFAIGALSGIALMLSAARQGDCVASAIHSSKEKPEIFGLSIIPAGVVEGFAVFAFIFALVLTQSIDSGAALEAASQAVAAAKP